LSCVVVGVGNILFKDEGVGVYASKFLEKNFEFEDGVEIIDGGTLGFKLMNYYQEYKKVIIIDTVSIDDTPGSIYNLPSDVLMGLGSYRQTAHEVEVVEMLEICSLLEKIAKVNVVGIVPEDIKSVDIDLSNTLKEAFDNLIVEVLNELKKENISYKRVANISLEEIIKEYNNPTMKELNAIKV